ncbi:competence protein ComK [Psychrobacillus sp. PGGUH221]|uniref:competence protein ComK n=1 Tax=Psychrobacillus sp. PGGUH221 TaxID=3020058 RepID=UPI0035C753A7
MKIIKDKSFLVSFETAVLQPVRINNKVYTKVTNISGETMLVGKKPYDIVRQSCAYYGSSFQQAKNLSRETLGNYLKLPIIIAHDYGNPCILIPLLSPKSDLNVWFSLKAIDGFHASKGVCKVLLTNGQTITVETSANTLSKQFGFANLLNTHFLKRMSHLSYEGFLSTRNQSSSNKF